MKCESFRNRLLALPSPSVPPAELVAHLTTCAGCRAFAARAEKLDSLIASLPVPSSELRKQAFLESLVTLGPVIQTRPTILSDDRHSGSYRPFRAIVRRIDWRYAAGIAAAFVVVVSAWLAWPAGKAPVAEKIGPRQELLARQNKHLAELALANTSDERLRVWADWSTDLRSATIDVYKAAAADEVASLERMFEKAVREGVLKHADRLASDRLTPERVATLRDAQKKLAETRAELERIRLDASSAHKPNLERMAIQAREAQEKLAELARGS